MKNANCNCTNTLKNKNNMTIYSFTILELGPRNIDFVGQKWAKRLMTMRPFGLNKEKPGGIIGSTSNMCRRSLDFKIQRP